MEPRYTWLTYLAISGGRKPVRFIGKLAGRASDADTFRVDAGARSSIAILPKENTGSLRRDDWNPRFQEIGKARLIKS